MGCDPIELDLAAGARTRLGRSESSRKDEPAAGEPVECAAVAPQLLDEAFALFEPNRERDQQADDLRAGADLQSAVCEALSGGGTSHSDSLSYSQLSTAKQRIDRQRRLVDSLSAQLAALDRQREHLARLLQDIDAAVADGADG
jgi:ABC-type transporter Mla subunit MlaD